MKLKLVVSVVHIFSMMCLNIPNKVNWGMEEKMRKLFWNSSLESDRIALLSWDKICQPKRWGDARLRDWNLMNLALGAKLVWKIYRCLD